MNQKGFTLIELIIVIIILGILAAIVIPKFVDLQDDARLSVMRSEAAAINAGLYLVHMKAIIDPIVDGKLDINGQSITIDPVTMYPSFSNAEDTLKMEMQVLVDIDLSRYDAIAVHGGFMLYPAFFQATNDMTCHIEYISVTAQFNVDTTGCF